MRRAADRGSALLLALALVVLAHAVAAVVATRVVRGAQAERRRLDHAQAFEAAEAGLAEAVQWLLQDDTGDIPEGDVGEATVEVDEQPATGGPVGARSVALLATARCRGAVERLELVVAITRAPGTGKPLVSRVSWRRLPGEQEER